MATPPFSPEASNALYAKLEEIATPHVEKSNGQLSILPHDLKNPAQALGVYCVAGQLIEPAGTDYIGTKAMPSFISQSYGLMHSDQGEPSMRQEAESLLSEKQSIVIVTDHDDVTSPAYPLGGFANLLRKANAYRVKEDKLHFETGIIVSKMLSVLAYEVDGHDSVYTGS